MGKEPLMTMGTFRSGKHLGWSAMASWKHEVRCLQAPHALEYKLYSCLSARARLLSGVHYSQLYAYTPGLDRPAMGLQVFFGWNLAALSEGTVAVGDELIVKKTRTAALAA